MEVVVTQAFADLTAALDQKAVRNSLRSALRKSAGRVKQAAVQQMKSRGLGAGSTQKLSKSIRTRVYPQNRGFLVTVKPHGKKGYHRNRFGKEKPVLMWAEEGTAQRYTRVRGRKRHSTGSMKAYRFMQRAEDMTSATIEKDLLREYEVQLQKRLKQKGF